MAARRRRLSLAACRRQRCARCGQVGTPIRNGKAVVHRLLQFGEEIGEVQGKVPQHILHRGSTAVRGGGALVCNDICIAVVPGILQSPALSIAREIFSSFRQASRGTAQPHLGALAQRQVSRALQHAPHIPATGGWVAELILINSEGDSGPEQLDQPPVPATRAARDQVYVALGRKQRLQD